ncbi:MAG: hypothetical protein ACRD1J_05540 [Terriglobia bacterium]
MRTFAVILFALFACTLAFGQASPSPPTTSGLVQEPAAVALVNQAVASAAGAVPVHDITLEGTATYTSGSDIETGTATLEATSRDESLISINLSDGSREWIRQGPAGVWIGPDGQAHAMAIHNCWMDAAWFFPALSLEAASGNPAVGLSSAGPGTWQGASVERLQWSTVPPGQPAKVASAIQSLAATEISLDASSLLPVAIDFNLHPDEDAGRNLPVEIRFSDYRIVSGVRMPFHIQKYLQGGLLLDITVTSAAINTGLPDSVFNLPAVPGGQP